MSIDTVIKEDPAHALVVVPPNGQEDTAPDDSWSLDDLRKYALDRLGEANLLARRSTVQTYRAGWALSIAQKREKDEREWVEWQKKHGLKRTPVWEAIKLFERAPSEAAIKDLTPQQAKEKYKIVKKRESTGGGPSRRKAKGSTTQPQPHKVVPTKTTPAQAVGGPTLDLVEGDGKPPASCEANHDNSLAVSSSAAANRQERDASVGILKHRSLTGIEAAGEDEHMDEALLGQANDLVHKMNQATRMAFVAQPLVLAAVRRLPRVLTTAA